MDTNLEITTWNHKMSEVTSLRTEEVMGKPFESVMTSSFVSQPRVPTLCCNQSESLLPRVASVLHQGRAHPTKLPSLAGR